MDFSLPHSLEVLERTPEVLHRMLHGISEDWTSPNEGEGTWSVFDVVGHLIHGDKTDWLVRTRIILSDQNTKTFDPFDRFAQFETSKGKTLDQLLHEFRELRQVNIERLRKLNITEADLAKTGIHPTFGTVTLRQLLATWVVHDLNHIAQISRIMAKQYTEEVGPWIDFLRILKS
ncbi:DinB family protein [Telluribacter sp. SYSU D00476]|uniref:DinB family protein n=1 Tax=Telluribacter sp. SYSU D00476 TaxID=2811430 RepID=UPI001FF62519|nr:DinB family protein [Telluribacter sp. SYSU D00476]